MTAKVMVYQTLMVSPELTISAVDPAGIMVETVERFRQHIPDRVYGIERRIIRVVAEPPWDLQSVGRGGSHVDPLAMRDTYSLTWASSNLSPPVKAELAWAQSILANIPEGAMLPEGFGQYVYRDTWPRTMDFPTYITDVIRGELARAHLDRQRVVNTPARVQHGLTSIQKALKDLGIDTDDPTHPKSLPHITNLGEKP